MKKIEVRNFNFAFNHDDEMVLRGLIPYEKTSVNIGFYEVLKRGCFKKTVNESRDIHFLEEHDASKLRARGKNGSLVVREDDEGVHFEVRLVDTHENRDLYTKVKSGLLDNVSFGFQVIKDRWNEIRTQREILEARLFEISAVGDPAYEDTTLSCRSLSNIMEGAESLSKENVEEIKGEIEKLSALLKASEETTKEEEQSVETDNINEQDAPEKEEPNKDAEPASTPEEHKEEPGDGQSEAHSEAPTQKDATEEKEDYSKELLEKLLSRLDAVEKILKEEEAHYEA